MLSRKRNGVAVYVIFTLALSSVFYFLMGKSGKVGGPFADYMAALCGALQPQQC